jgi:hypothetical protein
MTPKVRRLSAYTITYIIPKKVALFLSSESCCHGQPMGWIGWVLHQSQLSLQGKKSLKLQNNP